LEEVVVEQWASIPGYEGIYEVSSNGQVRSLSRVVAMPDGTTRRIAGRILKRRVDSTSTGYVYVSLCANGEERKTSVHQQVLLAFVGPANGLWALHRDGDRSNPALSNLYYGSPKQNSRDMVTHGNSARGQRNSQAKLDAEIVQWIRESSQSSLAVAAALEVDGSTVRAVRLGKNWSWTA
jgi:hypothetical protein